MRRPFIVAMWATLVLGIPAANATDWYVSVSGSDLNKGSATSPFRTITHALGAAIGGDVVNVSDGLFGSGEAFPLRPADGVTLRGAGADRTTIDGAKGGRSGILECPANLSRGMAISGFLFLAGSDEASDQATASRGGAIRCEAPSLYLVTIERNAFENNSADSHNLPGRKAEGGAIYGTNLWVVNNYFHSNRALAGPGAGGGGGGTTMGGHGGDAVGGALFCGGCIVENNTFWLNVAEGGSGGDGIPDGLGGAGLGGGAFVRGEVVNNIFANNRARGGLGSIAGVSIDGGLSGSGSITRNLYFDNLTGDAYVDGVTGASPLFSDPLLTLSGAIRWSSPAKDAGIFTARVAFDLFGRQRPVAPSIGAAEPLQRPRGDFDRDGASDILWRNAARGEARQWFMTGTGVGSTATLDSQPAEWQVAGVGDFNGGDYADILWRNSSTGVYSVWLMLGSLVAEAHVVGSADSTWTVGGIGDFDGDGREDILFRNVAMNTVAIWFMNASAAVTPRTVAMTAGPEMSVVGVGDFDGDRYADILWRNTTTNQLSAWLMRRETIAGTVSYGPLPPELNAVAIADFDQDGRTDVIWQNTLTTACSLWSLDATHVRYSGAFSSPPPDWWIAATGDFNADGITDLFWRNTAGNNAVWLLSSGLRAPAYTLPTTSEPDLNWTVAGPR